MAVAALAHVFVFSAEPYHFLPASEYGKVTTQTTKAMLKIEDSNEEKPPSVLEKTETKVEAPGTSVKESVQDIVLEGGQHVVKDVVLTINQAIEPVEKGVAKIQETFHHISMSSGDHDEEQILEVDEHEEARTENGSEVLICKDKLISESKPQKGEVKTRRKPQK
ncbi:unnamed protein product [Ilex paraguariensis]|uniref:Uncharacterized protein n=1 Tax=Ilex paraguariensis TaxID=185542 RepID=A0ABC8STJ9_9AQUA